MIYLVKKLKKKSISQYFRDGDNVITNKLLIANKFNSFFTNFPVKSGYLEIKALKIICQKT